MTVYYSLPTLRLHGCCLSVRPLVRSTRGAHCHLRTHEHTPLDMMLPSSLAWIPCCMLTLLPACLLWLPHVHSSRCATVDLDSAAPSAMPSRRFGHLGPTRSQPSRVETVPSLKPSRVLWMAPGLCLTPWLPICCLEGCHRVPAGYRFPGPRVGCSAFGGAPCVARGRRR